MKAKKEADGTLMFKYPQIMVGEGEIVGVA